MLSNFEHLTAAELQQHGVALRALGCSLLGRDDADDLVQESWLAALQAPSPRHLGGWLVGTVRRLAASRRRAEVRRRRREQVVAKPEALPAVVDMVAQAEVMHRVAAEVVGLNEPYRTAVVLRFWHGLSPRQLAARLSVPVDTARSRVQRGIVLLRLRLSHGCGDAWMAPLGAMLDGAAPLPAAATAAASDGSWLRSCATVRSHAPVLVVASATLAVTLLIGWYVVGPASADPPARTDTSRVADAAGTGTRQPEDVLERTAVAAPAVPGQTSPNRSGQPGAVLAVLLRGAGSGAPLVGFGVGLKCLDNTESLVRPSTSTLTFTPTDSRGHVVFHGLAAGAWSIEVDRIGFVARQEVEAGKHHERLVEVPAGITVTGTVVDARGNPAAGAAVVIDAILIRVPPTVATCDTLGRYRAEHIPPRAELLAIMPGRVPSLAQAVLGEQGSIVELNLRLGGEGRRLDGRALSASGMPLDGALVALLSDCARQPTLFDIRKPQVRVLWLRTDSGGWFATDQIDAGRHVVFVLPADPHMAPSRAEADTTAGDAHVEVRSTAGATVVGTVRRLGAPVPGVQVGARPTGLEIGYIIDMVGLVATTGADGVYRLEGLMPGPHRLYASGGREQFAEAFFTVQEGSIETWDLEFAAAPLRLRLRPATVTTQHEVSALVRKGRADRRGSITKFDSSGMALVQGLRSGPVDIVVEILDPRTSIELARCQAVPPSATEVTIDVRPEDLPVRMLKGRVVDGRGLPVAGVPVAIRRDGTDLAVRCLAVTGTDGTFAVGPLPVGRYLMSVDRDEHEAEVNVLADRDEDFGDLRVGR